MENPRVEVIDKTLVVLWDTYGEKLKENIPELMELARLIYLIGSDYIEITPKMYKELLYPIPEDVDFKFRVNNIIKIDSAHDIDIVIQKNSNSTDINNVRIVGLDDLIFYKYEEEFTKIMTAFGSGIEMCIGNNYCCSTAMTVEWLRMGGEKVITSFAGIGGYTPLEELLCSIEFIQKINLRGDHKLLPKALEIFEKLTGEKVPFNKPFIGKDIFNVESGIHVNGIDKNPETFEPYDPCKIGRHRKIIIGKHSGIKAIEIKLSQLSISYDTNNLKIILDEVRKKSMENRRGLHNEEIIEICERVGSGYE